MKVHEPDRNMTNLEVVHNLTCNAAPAQNIILGGANRQNPPHPVRNNSAVQKMNHVEIPSNPGNPKANDSFLCDAHQYNKKHRQPQPSKDSHNRDRAKKPEHYALL